MSNILQEALKYLEMGISVIPMTTYLDEREKVKKKPIIQWAEFQTRLPSTDEIREWFTQNPKALIGGVCGKISNLSAVDCDNSGAVDLYASLIVKEPTKKTPTSRTPRGGNHFLYNASENCPGPVSTPDGLDFRGEKSIIILPPSQNCRGERYEFLPGLSLHEVERPSLPQSIIDFVRSNSFSKRPGEGFNGQMFLDGNRDNSLFHIALCLVKGGMPENEIYQVLLNLIISWGETPDPKWIRTKIESAIKRKTGKDRNLKQEVRDAISITMGTFRVAEIYRLVANAVPEDRAYIRVVLSRLVEEGIVERVGKEDGLFRRIENDEQRIDIRQNSGGEIRLAMPFGLEDKVKILPKNIIIIGGTPDGGKTAFLLNVAIMNRDSHNIFYFTSEMGKEDLQVRVDLMGISREEWYSKITTIERSSNFSDVIRPEGLNIIDFLELSGDDYLKVGEHIRRIWEKLTTGVCFIAIQKRYGCDLPQGGIGAIEKARFALSFDRGVVKIVKAKNWRDGRSNPNGLEMEFKLVDGWKFIEGGPWTKASQPVKIPSLYQETERQYKQAKKRMGKTQLTKEFEGIVS
ncbi:MAG: bifunctional DNA primase/polymerase [Thermodesulfobacteriota bacterium]